MRPIRAIPLFAVSMILLQCIGACIFWPDKKVCTTDCTPAYAPRTSPGNVMSNVVKSFGARDFNQYSLQLCGDYVFRFIPDVGGHSDSLIRNQEVNFAENLFSNGSSDGAQKAAARISLVIDTRGAAGVADPRVGHEGWIRYYVSTRLAVNLTNGDEFNVISPAYLYFHRDASGSWCLAEWQDETPSQRPGRLFSDRSESHCRRAATRAA